MADAANPDGDILAKRLKASTYPYFALFNKTGERMFAYISSNISRIIVSFDKRIAKLDSTKTIRYKYKSTTEEPLVTLLVYMRFIIKILC